MTTNANYASFGSGLMIAKNLTANSQPVIIGALQDISLELSGKTESLYGQGQMPLLAARGEFKISCKAKTGYVSGPLYSSLVLGVTAASGTTSVAYAEAHAVPASPYQVTVTNSATFVEDMGVINATTGVPWVPVAAAPATGQYTVSAGVYTFAAADTGLSMQFSYTYTQASVGSTMSFGNPLQGVQPVFKCIIQRSYNNVGERYMLQNCIASKLSLPTSMAKFAISELDFDVFAGAGGNPITLYTDS